jgi:hypothetical protein
VIIVLVAVKDDKVGAKSVPPDDAQYVPVHFQFEAVSLSLPSSITLNNRLDSINVIMKSHYLRFEVMALFITILILRLL